MKKLSFCNLSFFMGCSAEHGIVSLSNEEERHMSARVECSSVTGGMRNRIAQPQA